MDQIKEIITRKVQGLIDYELEKMTSSPIFVFIGIDAYIDINVFNDNIVDKDTFLKNGNHELFNQDWITMVFTSLQNKDKCYHILSFQQYSYLTYWLKNFFIDRIIIIRDTLRMLLPICQEDFLSYNNGLTVVEDRPGSLPEYMAELLRIGNKYFYSINAPLEKFATVSLFEEKKVLKQLSVDCGYGLIDIVNDPHGLDMFINQCLEERNFSKKY